MAGDLGRFGEGRSWRLLEKVAAEITELVLAKYKAKTVVVTVKKFVLPAAKHVSVSVHRNRA